MKYNLRASLVASVTAFVFIFASCTNGIGEAEAESAAETNANNASATSSGTSGTNGGMLITFTGNPAYDITLLNDYWSKHGTPFPAPENAVVASRLRTTGSTTTDIFTTAADGTSSRSAIAGSGNLAPLYDVDTSKAINGFGDLVKNFSGTNFLTWAGGAALTGGISASMNIGLTMALDALGIVKSTSSYLAEISSKLDKIQDQLNTMQTMIEELGTKLYAESTKQGTLTRYYNTMQSRDSQYNNIYIDALVAWNSINDILLDAALSSQYTNAREKSAKLAELNTKEKRLAYLKDFIDSTSWDKATSVDQVSVVDSDAGKKFQAYFTEHASEISASLAAIVKNWGANQNTGASSVFKLCKYLTDTNKGTASESFNMFQLYDKYAEVCFVWEQEGYNFRQQMRDQDSALIAMTSTLAYWYYAITETLGASSTNCKELSDYVDAAIALNKSNPVVRYSTPIYQKWGSKWQGQLFTGTLKQIDYRNVMTTSWEKTSITKSSTKGFASSRPLKDDNYRYNGSRLYAGLGPKTPPSDKNTIDSTAANMALPEEFFQEVFDAYTVTTVSGTTHKPLMDIFKSVGFAPENGVKIPKIYQNGWSPSEKNEQFFITNRRTYVRQILSSGHDYYLFVPVVIANSMTGVVYNADMGEHEGCPLIYNARYVYCQHHSGRHSYSTDETDSYRICYKVTFTYGGRTFFYPEKTDKVVVAQ